MNVERIKQIDIIARENFVYKSDGKFDVWRSFAKVVGKRWKGDCDDLTATVLDLLSNEGVESSKLWRVQVSTKGNNKADHMLAMVEDDQGRLWFLGDTNIPGLKRAGAMKYRLIATSRCDERNEKNLPVWRKILNAN